MNSNQFMSLEKFLCLPDVPGHLDYKWDFVGTGWNLVRRYLIAKSSFLRYGQDGPPIGSSVRCLRSNGTLTFEGANETYPQFFSCSRIQTSTWSSEVCYSSHYREFWWRELQPIEKFSVALARGLETVSSEDMKKRFDFVTDELITAWLDDSRKYINKHGEVLDWMREYDVLC